MIVGAAILPAVSGVLDKGEDTSGVITQVAKRLPFRVAVTERGTVDSLKSATLTCSVEGSTTIISIVPEGTLVKKGQIVCELDSSALREQETQQQITLTQAKAELEKAIKNVEIQLKQNESDIAAAALKRTLAELDYTKFTAAGGEYEQQVGELEGTKKTFQEELSRAQENYEFTKRLAKKGYKTQNDVEASRIAALKAKINLDVEGDKLRVLEEFTHMRTVSELDANKKESLRECERVKMAGLAALAQYQSEVEARKLTHEVETVKLERLTKQIQACTMRAPQDGEVVYPSESSRRSDAQLIQAGATVRERQTIIKLPDLSQMKVDANIHESRISLVKKGLPVLIRVDAAAGEVFEGVVDSVSSVPMSTNYMRPDLKEYEAVVQIREKPERIKGILKPGLTAAIEIVVSQRSNVLQVPWQAVVGIGPKRYAFVISGGRTERRDVVIGGSNDTSVEVLEGVKEGDLVAMNPRSCFAEELGELEAAYTESQNLAKGESAGDQASSSKGGGAEKSQKPSDGSGGGPGERGAGGRQP